MNEQLANEPTTTSRWPIVVIFLCVMALGIALASAGFSLLRPEPFNPLGDYPLQTVSNRVDGIPGPSLHLGEELHVTGTKCNNSMKDVGVEGSNFWQLVIPGGFTVPGVDNRGRGTTSVRHPGCETRTFQNVLPPAVVDRTRQLFAQGLSQVVWSLQGTETPISSTGRRGSPRQWRTENFTIVP